MLLGLPSTDLLLCATLITIWYCTMKLQDYIEARYITPDSLADLLMTMIFTIIKLIIITPVVYTVHLKVYPLEHTPIPGVHGHYHFDYNQLMLRE